jgi:hypothetical protein
MGLKSIIIGVLTIVIIGLSFEARALTCPGGIVSTGDLKAQVHLKCGEPALWDQWLEETTVQTGEGADLVHSKTVDEWTYDFGSSRFITTLVFHDGQLVSIKSGDYGGKTPRPRGERPRLLSLGDTKAEVLLAWGEPAYRDHRREVRTVLHSKRKTIQKTVEIDEWLYDFGPDRFTRLLTFENNRLKSNRSGARGRITQ